MLEYTHMVHNRFGEEHESDMCDDFSYLIRVYIQAIVVYRQ